MNRRSFLLGLATVPLAGIAVAAPITVVGIDVAGADGMAAVVVQTKSFDPVRNCFYYDETFTLQPLASTKWLHTIKDRPDVFLKMITTEGRI